jgi:hypothetical protein
VARILSRSMPRSPTPKNIRFYSWSINLEQRRCSNGTTWRNFALRIGEPYFMRRWNSCNFQVRSSGVVMIFGIGKEDYVCLENGVLCGD